MRLSCSYQKKSARKGRFRYLPVRVNILSARSRADSLLIYTVLFCILCFPIKGIIGCRESIESLLSLVEPELRNEKLKLKKEIIYKYL